jgi:hypothetical protein
MLKVGDFVIVRKDLHEGRDYEIYCNSDMEIYRGRLAKILKIQNGYITWYSLCIDKKYWKWTEDMFEGVMKC